jgi:hypothetical protein
MALDTRTTDLVPRLLDELETTKDPRRLEALADLLGAAHDERAIPSLLNRLGDWSVQEDTDVEDAVCTALVELHVMHSLGHLRFFVLPPQCLTREAAYAVEHLRQLIPTRYFSTGSCLP